MTNKELLKIAQKHIGQGGARFRKYCGLPSGAAWCNAFVDYVANEGGVKALYFDGKKETYCPHSIAWCKKNLAQVPLYLAMPMDIIYFDWDRNGNPNHIGFVREHKDTSSIYTIEGNTNGGVVAQKTRAGKYVQAVYRPHFKASYKEKALTIDGEFYYQSVGGLQSCLKKLGFYKGAIDCILGLNTMKAWQKWAGCTPDGCFGKNTAMSIQRKLGGLKIDGKFGASSTKAMQRYINDVLYKKPTPQPKPQPTKPTLKSHKIEIDLTNQIATVYGIYSDGSKKGIMSEWVSTARKGKVTPTGNFKIQGASGGRKAKLRTARLSSGKSYAEYLCRFHGPKCMHCVPYKKRNTTGHVNKNAFNKLGSVASAGCVRMPNVLAKYIYLNCPVGTPVRVFKGKKGEYPMGKPKKYTATTDIDPTYKK